MTTYISVILPSYNEAENLQAVVREITVLNLVVPNAQNDRVLLGEAAEHLVLSRLLIRGYVAAQGLAGSHRATSSSRAA